MKFFLLLLLFSVIQFSYAQDAERRTEAEEISVMEAKGHQKLFNSARQAAASNNFDIQYYRCEWEVDPAVRYIKGKVTTHFVMNTTGSAISLDLADELNVSAITQRGFPLTFSRTNNTLTIQFSASILAGIKDSITIVYEGVPPTAAGSFVATTHGAGATLSPIIWTLSEPFGSKDWWPCKNGLDDKADSIDIYITHPVAFKSAANGLLQSETPVAGGKLTTHWKHRYSIASYLVCFAVSNYTVLNHSVLIGGTNVPMKTYCYPENQGSFQAGTQNALNAMVLYSSLFGDYPFKKEKYGHVQFGWGGGMEHQTNSFMVSLSEGLVAHELGHQWFGDKVTCGSWEDIWLNEGFATHLASIYMENKYPANAKATRTAEINSITSLPDGSVWVDNINDVDRIFSNRLSYYKGSHLLYMLRWILGDAIFFTAINNYINDPALAYGFATTGNLKNHLEAASDKNLSYFFDQWFTGQGYPSYDIQWFPVGNKVDVKISQSTSHASVGFFQLPVPLLFKNSVTLQQKLVVLDNTANGELFTENLGFEADQVVFDPDVWLISRNNVLTKISTPLPVLFSGFHAECSGSATDLHWETSEQINADFFEILHSEDALSWKSIGKVQAAGSSYLRNAYTFRDTSGKQPSYYKIAEQDKDGRIQFTRIVSSECGSAGKKQITLAPNPVREELLLTIPDDISLPVFLSIYDIKGIKYQHDAKYIQSGKNTVNVSRLPTGVYILKWKDEDKHTGSIRFLKE